jgi:AcrR family transcriptional regulator
VAVTTKSRRAPRRIGRPRAFDPERALDRALDVFWRKGYEGASLSDLTRAMGINRPSLYAAFGDKQSLFRQAVERYSRGPAAYLAEALREPTARRAVECLLRAEAELLTVPGNPRGCLLVQGALACGDAADSVRRELIAQRAKFTAAIHQRLKRARSEGDVPPGADPADLARFVATVMNGMAVQAAGGATRGQLLRVAQTALKAWPTRN